MSVCNALPSVFLKVLQSLRWLAMLPSLWVVILLCAVPFALFYLVGWLLRVAAAVARVSVW